MSGDAVTIEQQPPLHTIHVWEEPVEGQVWACCAYDHGPFCRLCQRVDETLMALLQNVQQGMMDAKAGPDGEFQFKMTVKGTAKVEDTISTDPAMAMFWARITKAAE